MSLRQDFFVNYKEFMEWFFLNKVFYLLSNSSNKYHTGLERVIAGFKLLGLRLTDYNMRSSITRFDSSINDNMVNFKKTFLTAITEEINCNRMLLVTGLRTNVMGATGTPTK
jgi:hypothetical protein